MRSLFNIRLRVRTVTSNTGARYGARHQTWMCRGVGVKLPRTKHLGHVFSQQACCLSTFPCHQAKCDGNNFRNAVTRKKLRDMEICVTHGTTGHWPKLPQERQLAYGLAWPPTCTLRKRGHDCSRSIWYPWEQLRLHDKTCKLFSSPQSLIQWLLRSSHNALIKNVLQTNVHSGAWGMPAHRLASSGMVCAVILNSMGSHINLYLSNPQTIDSHPQTIVWTL